MGRVAVEVLATPVVDRGGAGVSVTSGDVHVTQRDAGVECGHDERSAQHVRTAIEPRMHNGMELLSQGDHPIGAVGGAVPARECASNWVWGSAGPVHSSAADGVRGIGRAHV